MKPHIYNVRGTKVMLDSDLAAVFGVETKVLNQKVKRNMSLFSEGNVFQLTREEYQSELISCSRSQVVTMNGGRGSNRKYSPFAFTKEGVTVLKTLMKSQVEVNFSEDPSLPAIAENCWNEGTVVLYQPDDTLNIEVRVDDETVWLTQEQIAQLFRTTRNNISIHINNIFVENELEKGSVCKDSLLTATDGKMYQTRLYNLDVIISVGYRVKSVTGVRFRQWANKVMRNYILKKGSYEERLIALEVNHRQTTKILNEHQERQ